MSLTFDHEPLDVPETTFRLPYPVMPSIFAVIVVEPKPTAVISPDELIVATEVLLLDHPALGAVQRVSVEHAAALPSAIVQVAVAVSAVPF